MVAHYGKRLQDHRADFGNQVHLPWRRHPLESIVVSIRQAQGYSAHVLAACSFFSNASPYFLILRVKRSKTRSKFRLHAAHRKCEIRIARDK
jgi:hypothetical protein